MAKEEKAAERQKAPSLIMAATIWCLPKQSKGRGQLGPGARSTHSLVLFEPGAAGWCLPKERSVRAAKDTQGARGRPRSLSLSGVTDAADIIYMYIYPMHALTSQQCRFIRVDARERINMHRKIM